MKKFFAQLVICLFFINLAITIGVANAAGPIETIRGVGEETGLPSFYETGQHPDAPPDFAQPGVGTITSPIYFAIDLFRLIVSGAALIVIGISTVKLVSVSSEEDASKIKTHLIFAIVGLLLIQIADVFVKQVFFGEQGDAFEDVSNAQIFGEEGLSVFRSIVGFVQVFLGIVAVLVIVIRGMMVITSAGDEEALSKAKRQIIYALVALGVVGISELVIRGFIFPNSGQELPNVEVGKRIIVMITNYLAGFVSIFAFASLFYGGYRYVVSGGNEEFNEKIKKIVIGSVIAILLSLGAFALINTLIEFEDPIDTQDVREDLPISE